MDLIAVWSPKGGVGKSTLALNLAGAGHYRGKKVLLVDYDRQGSCYWAFTQGNLPFEVLPDSPTSKPDVDLVIFDYPPSDNRNPEQRRVVLPYMASAFDFVATKKYAHILAGNIVTKVVNRVDARIAEQRDHAFSAIRSGAFVVKQRSIYARMNGEGRTVFDERATGISGYANARNEMLNLFDDVMRAK